MYAALNPNLSIDLDLMRIAIKESGSITRVNSLEPLRDIYKYKMLANVGRKNYDGTYGPDLAKSYFIDNVINDNIHACIDSYQERLANGQDLGKEQLMDDYYAATFLVMDYESSFMFLEGARLGFQSCDKQWKTPITKLKEIRDTLEKMPGLQTEYNQYKFKEDGTQRSLSEMIDYARDNSGGKVFLPFMQTVVRETDVAKDDNSLSMLESLNKFIHVASEDREVEFINGVIRHTLPICIDNYSQTLEDAERNRTDNDLIAYQNIVTYLNTSKENKKVAESVQAIPNSQEGNEPKENEQTEAEEPKKTITERLEEIKSMMEDRWPGIDVAAAKLDSKRNKVGLFGRSTAYDQLKKIKVSAVGKKNAAEMETKMAEKKHEIEYDG